MGFRFRRSVKLMPGVRLNFSTRGVSTTLGGRGASVNLSKRGAYLNTGIPGTGISARTKLDAHSTSPRSPSAPSAPSAPPRGREEGALGARIAAASIVLLFAMMLLTLLLS